MGVKVRQWKGAWWVFVDHKRRRKAKRIGTGQAGLRAAEDIAKAYEVQLTLGRFDFSKASNITFEGYTVEWLETYGRTLKLGTLEKYTESTAGPLVLLARLRQGCGYHPQSDYPATGQNGYADK
jgi:hypothetical protein